MSTSFVWTCLVSVALVVAGCDMGPVDDSVRDDEAMQRAKRAHVLPEQAAYDWFYPKKIDNYFKGMDAVALDAPTTPGTEVRPAHEAHPHQLLVEDDYASWSVEVKDVVQTPQEILGRNTWMMWSGGNEAFWDWLARRYGFLDFLRLLDSRNRATRFADGGLINEPEMTQASSEDDFGLWLDVPTDPVVREWRRAYIRKAFNLDSGAAAAGQGYGSLPSAPTPQSINGYAAGDEYRAGIPPPDIYGISSGIVGLRLFPNPNFDAKARKRWNEDKDSYYTDPDGDPLIRPYRVGMGCAFCHASYHPLNPPRDLVNPEWTNISGNIGAQYLRMRPVFGNLLPPSNFIYHILDSQPAGTVDTSLIASDNINNPNTMNAVFNLRQRVLLSLRNPKEQLNGASSGLPAIWLNRPAAPGLDADVPSPALVLSARRDWAEILAVSGMPPFALPVPAAPEPDTRPTTVLLDQELAATNDPTRRVPRILLDGADSIGAWGALARVYLNIGMNSEQWNVLHEPVVGFKHQSPFTIDNVERHSVYWHATKLRVGALRDYFLAISPSMPLLAARTPTERAAPRPTEQVAEGAAALPRDRIRPAMLERGRRVFAENCIVCHSSVQPAMRHEKLAAEAAAADLQGNSGAFWDPNPGQWLENKDYMDWAHAAVETEEFWKDNYLSTDYRIPVSYVGTNSCRALATNAITGNMWEDFASTDYRDMPSVGPIPYFNPYLGENGGMDRFTPRHRTADGVPPGGGGPGFYRVPSLVSIWATAPFLHNNSLGKFNNDPSIRGRLEAFDDAIRKLLWPAQRRASSSYNGATRERLERDQGLIWRTTEESYLSIAGVYLPEILGSHLSVLRALSDRWPWLREVPPAWRPVPTGVLLVLAFLFLRWARGPWTRAAGYGAILAGLGIGTVVYFLNGGLGGLRVGPIPKGTPVSLLANTNPDAPVGALLDTIAAARSAFTEIASTRPDSQTAQDIVKTQLAPQLMAISKCPDFVMDRGHYFRWFDNMSDPDKEALIELLKTF